MLLDLNRDERTRVVFAFHVINVFCANVKFSLSAVDGMVTFVIRSKTNLQDSTCRKHAFHSNPSLFASIPSFSVFVSSEITLIMVTHDTALKAYASRVVHMIDGKIHRIETIANATRQNAYSELAKKARTRDFD
jgi:hypothetical protein